MTIRRTELAVCLVVLSIILPGILSAQSPRKLLLEQITNQSKLLARDIIFGPYYRNLPSEVRQRIIPVAYHINFPEKDSSNILNPALHDSRAAYYKPSDIPVVLANGKISPSAGGLYPGSPDDTAVISKVIAEMNGEMSPITITITESITGGRMNGTVRVSSTEALAGKKLYIIATEYAHTYRNLTELTVSTHYFAARQMVPDNEGIDLALAAGEERNIPVEIQLSPHWWENSMHLIAFVQDTATKEVLQAESSMAHAGFSIADPRLVVQKENAPVTWTATLTATHTGRYFFAYYPWLPYGWQSSLELDGQPFQDDSIDMEARVPRQLRITITPGTESPSRRAEINLGIYPTRGYTDGGMVALYSGEVKAYLLARHENAPTQIASYYEEALAASGVSYAFLGPGEFHVIDPARSVLVAEFGKNAMNIYDVEELKKVFDRGVPVLLAGAEIAYGLADPSNTDDELSKNDIPFLRNYLHADYINDDGNSGTVDGAEGDPIGNGLRFSITTGVKNQDTPDELAPRDGAAPIFYYGTEKKRVAGIRYADARNRLVYLGFGLEGVGNVQHRTELMRRSLEWLFGTSSVEAEPVATSLGAGDVRPNPASGRFDLPIRMERTQHLRAALYDMRGEQVALLEDGIRNAGEGVIRFDASSLPPGIYSVVITTPQQTETRRVTVVQ